MARGVESGWFEFGRGSDDVSDEGGFVGRDSEDKGGGMRRLCDS